MERIAVTCAGLSLALAGVVFFVAGCASTNVNPASPVVHTGYVDFFAQSSEPLAWDVQRFDSSANRFSKLFSQIEPVEGRVLRLALAPGHHRLRITFLNRVISDPALIEVEVRDGQVTPVEMTLTATGTAFVRTEEQRRGGTARGRYGRATKVASDESQMYRVTATLQTPRPYQLKEQMPYAQNPAK